MNLEIIQEQWSKDSQIDSDLYGEESVKIARLHAKYFQYINTFNTMKIEAEAKLKSLLKEKWKYYKGKAPATVYREVPFDFKLTTKEEVNMFIDADDDIRKLQYKIDYIDQVLFFLDGVLRQINSRNFQIKNAIEWEKFQAGM
mgnify:CR=1 FL=1